MTTLNESFQEILRRTEITCKARYHAAKRMSLHGSFSQWTLAILAVGQIVISLISALGLKSNFCPSYVNFASIFFGVLVLAYSLLLGMSHFSSRSVKHHACGLELGRLARQLTFVCKNSIGTPEEYNEATKSYYDILSKYENHTRTDYLVAHLQYYEAKAEKLVLSKWRPWVTERLPLLYVNLKIYFLSFLQFAHYLGAIALMSIWIFYFVGPAHATLPL